MTEELQPAVPGDAGTPPPADNVTTPPADAGQPATQQPSPAPSDKPAEPTASSPNRDTPSLIEEMGKEPGGEAKAEGDAVKPGAEGERQQDPPKPAEPQAPVYQDFTLPDGFDAAPETMTEYTGVLGKYGIPQEAGQALVDMHGKAMQAYAERVAQDQQNAFLQYRQSERTAVMADPELGGAGFKTVASAVARVRDTLVTEDFREDFERFLRDTGAGDHRAFVRLMYRMARYVDEPQYQHMEPKPPANGRAAGGRLRDFYNT